MHTLWQNGRQVFLSYGGKMIKKLTDGQRNELIGQYVQIVVDGMDRNSLIEFVTAELSYSLDQYDDVELKEDIDNYNEELYDELVEFAVKEVK